MAPSNDMFHPIPLIEELQRIAATYIAPTLGIKLVAIGDITTLPAPELTRTLPGIWIQPMPATTNDFMDLPRHMEQKYYFRFVYVRFLAKGENIVKKSMEDATFIMNTYTDYYQMLDITNLPQGTHVLWSIIKNIEWRPPEDQYVNNIHAELTSIVFNMELVLQTKRAS